MAKNVDRMARDTLLTLNEGGKIDSFTDQELRARVIYERISRSPNLIRKYLKNPDRYENRLFIRGNKNLLLEFIELCCMRGPKTLRLLLDFAHLFSYLYQNAKNLFP